jgi:hypothetical protein
MLHLVPFALLSELTKDPTVDPRKDFRHGGLADAELGGDSMLGPSEDGEFGCAELTRSNPRARFVSALTAATTMTRPVGHRETLAPVTVAR